MRKAVAIVVFTTLLMSAPAGSGPRRPWHLRIDKEVETFHITAHKKTSLTLWPEEPSSPHPVDEKQFRAALQKLCFDSPKQRIERYADFILTYSSQFEIDPFVLAALVYDQSRCWPTTTKRAKRMGRYGLTRLNVNMHRPHVQDGAYNYYLQEVDEWKKTSLPMDKFVFNKWMAVKPESNLYFAAAILSVLKRQEEAIHSAANSEPHRHYVSHYFYGDRVKSPEPENRVLTARRMLVGYYEGKGLAATGTYRGANLVSPLDGVPRLVLDYFGNKRGKPKGLGHRGIDLDGALGEPVRAIAAGRVVFAGVDLDGGGNAKLMEPKEANALENSQMGPGGLYVSINHGNHFGTIYMHLDSLAVKYRDEVEAGDIIGTLGRSGTERSGPHLHLEFRLETDRVDPAAHLKDVLVNPHAGRTKKK